MKTVLITGASGDIGLSIASTLAKNYKLILIYNKNKASIQKFISTHTECEIYAYQCDFESESKFEKTFKTILKEHKSIFGLVNCAGVSASSLVQDISFKDFSHIIDCNLKSAVMTTKYVVPSMISNKCGKIVNISSMWGVVGASMESLYSASKGAMNSFTLSIAKELGLSGINVNAVCPGFIDTKMNNCYTETDKQAIVDSTPLNRIGTPQDVANLVEFLIDEKSNFITGQIITVDGGLTL